VRSISEPVEDGDADRAARRAMTLEVLETRFTPDWADGDAAMAAYQAHNARVRAGVPAARLVEWQPGDGWEPICAALGVPVPDEEFPHENTTADFQANVRSRSAD